MSENVTLTPKQERAIAALMTSPTIEAAAESVGISRRQIYRWMNEPDFATALSVAQAELVGVAQRRLASALTAATSTIASIMVDKAVAPSTRLRAAESVLENHLKLKQATEMEERLARLEEQLHGHAE